MLLNVFFGFVIAFLVSGICGGIIVPLYAFNNANLSDRADTILRFLSFFFLITTTILLFVLVGFAIFVAINGGL